MPFDINKVPFYKAVALFEAEQYQEAFDLFFDCASKGNLYAPYYLKGLVKILENNSENKVEAEGKLINEGTKLFLETLDEYIKNIPTEKKPESWYQASCCIISLENMQKKGLENTKEKNKIINELEQLSCFASNAALALFKQYTKNQINKNAGEQQKMAKLTDIIATLMGFGDLYTLANFSLISLEPGLMEKFDQSKKEREAIDKYADLAYKLPGGSLERLISKFYDGKGVQKASSLEMDLRRKYVWQMAGAHLGCKELQGMFSQPSTINKRSAADLKGWLFVAAHNGERQAQILYAGEYLVHDKKQKRLFLEAGLKGGRDNDITDFLYSKGLLEYGLMHERGWGGLKKDATRAFYYYLQAEQLDCYVASGNIAVFFTHGYGGIEKNYKLALDYYQKALEGAKNNQRILGTYHFDIATLYYLGGYGLTQDYSKAVEHYEQALKYKAERPFVNYALMFCLGDGVKKNINQAFTLFINGANKYHATLAAYHIARMVVNKDIKDLTKFGLNESKMEEFIHLMLKKNDESAPEPYSIASLYYLEHSEKGPNYKKAFEYLRKGTLKNESYCYLRLGSLYEHGCPEINLEIDYKIAYEHYERAAALGNVVSLNNMGYFLAEGLGVPKNYNQAINYYETALERGEKISAYGLACFYSLGLGVPKDLKKAFEYLKIAEKTQDEDVLYSLGLFYHLNKEVVPQDLKLACEYYHRASEKGVTRAAHNYLIIKINQIFEPQTEFEYEALLNDLLKKAQLASKIFAFDTFLAAMLRLLINPKKLKEVVNDLSLAIKIKPYKRSKEAIEFLNSLEEVSILDIYILLVAKDDLSQVKKRYEEKLKIVEACKNYYRKEVNSTNENKIHTEETTQSNNRQKVDLLNNKLNEKSSKKSRLKKKIDNFIDPKNRKSIDIHQFKQLLGELAVTEGVITEMYSSKSSNTRYRLEHESFNKTICFSYHPTHSAGRGMDAKKDPKRAKDLQDVIRIVSDNLKI